MAEGYQCDKCGEAFVGEAPTLTCKVLLRFRDPLIVNKTYSLYLAGALPVALCIPCQKHILLILLEAAS